MHDMILADSALFFGYELGSKGTIRFIDVGRLMDDESFTETCPKCLSECEMYGSPSWDCESEDGSSVSDVFGVDCSLSFIVYLVCSNCGAEHKPVALMATDDGTKATKIFYDDGTFDD